MKLTCLKLYPHECDVGKHKHELQIRIIFLKLSTYSTGYTFMAYYIEKE